MAGLDDGSLFIFGGEYDPGIERCKPHEGMIEEDPSCLEAWENLEEINPTPGGYILDPESLKVTEVIKNQDFPMTTICGPYRSADGKYYWQIQSDDVIHIVELDPATRIVRSVHNFTINERIEELAKMPAYDYSPRHDEDSTRRVFCAMHALADGSYYEGEMNEDGQRDGRGKQIRANGDCYEGIWCKDKLNGRGRAIYKSDEGVYTGEFKDGFAHGFGEMIYESEQGEIQHKYKGQWANGKQHGHGIEHNGDGTVYDGEWKKSQMHGQGVLIYPNGNRFEGVWEYNERGAGIMLYENGITYDGKWDYFGESREGKGIMTYPNGSKVEVKFQQDKMVRITKVTSRHGSVKHVKVEYKKHDKSNRRGRYGYEEYDSEEQDEEEQAEFDDEEENIADQDIYNDEEEQDEHDEEEYDDEEYGNESFIDEQQ